MTPDILSLARATVDMGHSLAFLDMLDGLKGDMEKAERDAANAPATLDDRSARNLFIEWQVYKKIIGAMEVTIVNAAETIKAIEEENENERRIAAERASRGANWG